MEGVERTNAVIVNLNQQTGFIPRHNPYAIEVDCGRNCYNCRGFEHIARNCRN